MTKRRKPEPSLSVTVEWPEDDDNLLKVVADLLLDLVGRRHDLPAKPAQPRRRPAARKARRKPPKP